MAETEFLIRRAEPDDYVGIHEIYKTPSAYAGTLQLPFPSVSLWRDRLSHQDDNVFHLVAVVESGQVVGMITLLAHAQQPRRRHAGFVGMGVHEAWQGKGIGSALMRTVVELADNWLNLHRLELEVFADNESAIRLYERNGFEREGVLRDYAFRDGAYVDAVAMGRLRPAR